MSEKFSIYLRSLSLTDAMRQKLDSSVIDTQEVAPGQIRKKGEWYYLTFLRIVKIKNFCAASWDLNDTEINCTKVVPFRINGNKLYVNGSKSEIKEIAAYFDALALALSSADQGQSSDFSSFYRVDVPNVDLEVILKSYEDAHLVNDIKKLRMKSIEIALGKISKCIVNTHDYGGARKIVEDAESQAFGIGIDLKIPSDTTIYFDLDGQIVVNCNNDNVPNLEELVLEAANRV